MSFTVRLRPEAERELSAAASWYERQRVGLGQEFLDEFMAVHRRLADTPLMYSIVHSSAGTFLSKFKIPPRVSARKLGSW